MTFTDEFSIETQGKNYLTNYVSEHLEFKDKQGRSISFIEWAHLFYNPDYPFIKFDICGNYHITTQWIGFSLHESGYFRTLVTRESGEMMDSEYYLNQNEALEGHQMMTDFCLKIHEDEELDCW